MYARSLHSHRCRPVLGPHEGQQVQVLPAPVMGTIGGGGDSRHRRGEHGGWN
jgi:hypothetical protein